ncbi:MAG TPA: hypothetical protein VF607_11835, partial [Verrucomicrobiae bacterium]
KWRGRQDWDPEAQVGFSPGYPPDERRRLVDVYMAEFKASFGFYPKTVGSWYVDEITLAYLAEKYGIVAACNCKDQIGTDFYTLWGGYWNQAYYPSRLNAYMPAQHRQAQIEVPVFRMLGSDPIYQHGTTPGLQSLEPVYPESGGSARWVNWLLDNLVQQPCLAFGYTQAGQENSFGWPAMAQGYTNQLAKYSELARTGAIRLETLAQSGRWFHRHFPTTPATAVVCMDDWKASGHRTVWYDSRFYRLNVFWDKDRLWIRDLHCFDEQWRSPTHEQPLTNSTLAYETLPVVDWARWQGQPGTAPGMWPVQLTPDGTATSVILAGAPRITEAGPQELLIDQPLADGGSLQLHCGEAEFAATLVDATGHPRHWAWQIQGGKPAFFPYQRVWRDQMECAYQGHTYRITLANGGGTCELMEPQTIRLLANPQSQVILNLKTTQP